MRDTNGNTKVPDFLHRFNRQLEEGIMRFIAACSLHVPDNLEGPKMNFDLFSRLLINCIADELNGHKIIEGMVKTPKYSHIYPKLLLHEGINPRKQEEVIALLVQKASDGSDLEVVQVCSSILLHMNIRKLIITHKQPIFKVLFGDSVLSNVSMKKVLTKKMPIERRTQASASLTQRNSKKIVEYLELADKSIALVTETFFHLLEVFSDQARLLASISLHQQYQLAVALFDFGKSVRCCYQSSYCR